MTAAKVSLLGLALIVGGAVALSCSGQSKPNVDGYAATPASSQQRALARAQRAARKKALEDQGDAGPSPDAGPAPVPKPMTPEAGPLDAGSDAADAAAADAALDAGADAADAAAPPEAGLPSSDEICDKMCARVVECAKEMMSGGPPDMPIDDLIENVGKECADECKKQIQQSDEARIKRALACLEKSDCTEFMKCIREVLDEKS